MQYYSSYKISLATAFITSIILIYGCRKDVACKYPDLAGKYLVTVKIGSREQNGVSSDTSFVDTLVVGYYNSPYGANLEKMPFGFSNHRLYRKTWSILTQSQSEINHCNGRVRYRPNSNDGEIIIGNDTLSYNRYNIYSFGSSDYAKIFGTRIN